MLLQVIPYVADQFEPGAYVFDGENLSSSHLLKTSGSVSVYSITQNSFNAQSILSSGAAQSTYHIEENDFNKVAMLYALDALILTDFEADATLSGTVTSNFFTYLVGSETKQMQAVPNLEVMYSTVYFSQVDEQISKALGPSTFVPRILDTRSLDEPAKLSAKFAGSGAWVYSLYAESDVSFDIGTYSVEGSKAADFAPVDLNLDVQPVSILNAVEKETQTTSFKFVSPVGSRFVPSSEPSNNLSFSM